MEAERQPKMRAMIMADDRGSSGAPRSRSCCRSSGPTSRACSRRWTGCPVTIRLLDPPLHEFLPNKNELIVDLERAQLARPRDAARVAELERLLARVRELEEVNPMLGTRGCRLGILHPEIYEMQVRAIVGAALGGPRAHGRRAARSRS